MCKVVHVHGTSRILGQHECMNVELSSSQSQQICTSLTQMSNQCELKQTEKQLLATKNETRQDYARYSEYF